MESRKTSILLPSAYRARDLRRAVGALMYNTALPLEICVSVVADDYGSQNITRDLPIVLDVRTVGEYQLGAVYAWNKLLKRATGDVLALWADDLMPAPNWLDYALAALDQMAGHGVVGFNDLSSNGDEYAAHWLAARSYIYEHGGVMYAAEYRAWWCDREVTDIAKCEGRYLWERRSIVEHLNYTFGKSNFDKTYQDARQNYEADRVIYEMRKAKRESPTIL